MPPTKKLKLTNGSTYTSDSSTIRFIASFLDILSFAALGQTNHYNHMTLKEALTMRNIVYQLNREARRMRDLVGPHKGVSRKNRRGRARRNKHDKWYGDVDLPSFMSWSEVFRQVVQRIDPYLINVIGGLDVLAELPLAPITPRMRDLVQRNSIQASDVSHPLTLLWDRDNWGIVFRCHWKGRF